MIRAALVAVVAVTTLPHAAHADSRSQAEALYDEGQAAFDLAHFDDAVSSWERSYELSKEPGLLFNLGQAYRLRGAPGDCTRSHDAYVKFMQLDPASSQRSLAERFAGEPCATPVVVPTQATVVATPAPARAPSHPGRTQRIAGLATAGGGLALIATAGYFAHRAATLSDEVTKACVDASDCGGAWMGPDREGKSDETKEWIFGGLGLAALVAGGVIYWLADDDEHHVPTISLLPRRDGATIGWSRAW